MCSQCLGTEQCDIQECRAPRDGELRCRAFINRLLLQSEERLAPCPDPGACDARPALALPADDLRPVPAVHPAAGTEREVTSGVAQGCMMLHYF